MPVAASFDITSTIDFQEVDNALNQARKEVGQRYDFKGATADITLSAADKTLTLLADDEVIPLPRFRIDRLADGPQQMDRFPRGLLHEIVAGTHQRAERGRREEQ